MATGDVIISIAVEGGATKSAAFDSAAREKSKAGAVSEASPDSSDLSVDANWQVWCVNNFASLLISQANRQLEAEVAYTKKTFTAAS